MSKVPIRSIIETLPAYVPGARGTGAGPAFKLSSNENPFPPLPGVLAAVSDAAADLNRYPDMFATGLTESLAVQHGVDAENVVVGNGSVAVLGHILNAFCDPGDEVLYAWRSFEAYPIAVTLAGATNVQIPLDHAGRHDLERMAGSITKRTRVIILCSPNNPTGPVLRDAEVRAFLDRIPDNILVVLDEAYHHFATDPQVVDGNGIGRDYSNVVRLQTFSKAYGLAGLRVGYALGRRRLIDPIRAAATPFGINHLAQAAALVSLSLNRELTERVEAVVSERERIVRGLHEQGWELPDAQGNFYWLALNENAVPFAQASAQRGVIVRPFAGEGVRVSVGEPEANNIILDLASTWVRPNAGG